MHMKSLLILTFSTLSVRNWLTMLELRTPTPDTSARARRGWRTVTQASTPAAPSPTRRFPRPSLGIVSFLTLLGTLLLLILTRGM